jgi:predicted DNA-binding transcriptional regulator AlpA
MTKTWLKDTEVAERRGTSRVTVWRHVRAGLIPKPHRLGPGTVRWYLPEIEEDERRVIGGKECA